MPIQQNYQPRLDTPEIYAFLADRAQPPQPYKAPIVLQSGYELSNAPMKVVDSVAQLPNGGSVILYWAEKEHYLVVEGGVPGQVVGGFDVIVPSEQHVKITVYCYLAYKSVVPGDVRLKIETAFVDFQYPRDGDPQDYCANKMTDAGNVSRDMFSVDYTFSIEKVGNPRQRTEQRDQMLRLYRDSADGEISPGPGLPPKRLGDGGYFRERKIRAEMVFPPEVIGRMPEQSRDHMHQVEDDGRPPKEIIEKTIEQEGRALECARDFDQVDWKILKLLDYPEFKIVWRDYAYEIGCGVWVIISLPALQIRVSELNLYAYARTPKDLGAIVTRVLEGCIWRAALSGAVVGVVVGNFIAALQAFRAVFTECIKEKFNEFIACMIPGLLLISSTKPGEDWHDI